VGVVGDVGYGPVRVIWCAGFGSRKTALGLDHVAFVCVVLLSNDWLLVICLVFELVGIVDGVRGVRSA
jgi:hypothetical protein